MPEHIRALFVVLLLGSLAWLAIQPTITQATSHSVGRQWRNLWFTLTAAAFMLGNFWLYALLAAGLLLAQRFGPVQAFSAYCLLLMAVPAAYIDVPGLGLINYFFSLNQPRLLALLLLAPAAIVLSRQRGAARLGSVAADKYLLAFLLLAAVLQLRENNVTSSLRNGFYLLTDAFLPYYVASRAVQRVADFRQALAAYVMAASLMGLIALFETLRHWILYAAMTNALGLHWGYSGYLGRGGMLRALASVGHPIVLGYVMTVGLGFWFYLNTGRKLALRSAAPMLLMGTGLLASLSRGPWVGATAMVLAFAFTGRNGMRKVVQIAVGATGLLGLMAAAGMGQRVLNLLPFIGTVDKGNIDYRQRLIDNALTVIDRHFWFGSTNYMKSPEMQSMIQGEGIIDIVNSYIRIALDYGVVGLALFAGFFALIMWRLWRTQARLPLDDERRTLGRSLLAVLVGIAVTITTVGSVVVVPHIYWLVGGLAVAWLEVVRRDQGNGGRRTSGRSEPFEGTQP